MPQDSRAFGREMHRSPASFSTALRSSATRKSGTTNGRPGAAALVDEPEQPFPLRLPAGSNNFPPRGTRPAPIPVRTCRPAPSPSRSGTVPAGCCSARRACPCRSSGFARGGVFVVPQPLQDGAHAFLMAPVGGGRPRGVIHLQLFPGGRRTSPSVHPRTPAAKLPRARRTAGLSGRADRRRSGRTLPRPGAGGAARSRPPALSRTHGRGAARPFV